MLQRLPVWQRGFRASSPLFPTAVDRMDVGDDDVIISSQAPSPMGFAGPDSTHVCYCHSPFRYIWHERAHAMREVPAVAWPRPSRELERIRKWDISAASRVDHFIANSRVTQERIADVWGREATIIHPPVNTHRFTVRQPEDLLSDRR